MQLGTRWSAGGTVPPLLPGAVAAAIAEVEASLTDADRAGWRWQLTWLEGRPVVEADSGLVIRYDPVADAAIIAAPDEADLGE